MHIALFSCLLLSVFVIRHNSNSAGFLYIMMHFIVEGIECFLVCDIFLLFEFIGSGAFKVIFKWLIIQQKSSKSLLGKHWTNVQPLYHYWECSVVDVHYPRNGAWIPGEKSESNRIGVKLAGLSINSPLAFIWHLSVIRFAWMQATGKR